MVEGGVREYSMPVSEEKETAAELRRVDLIQGDNAALNEKSPEGNFSLPLRQPG